MCTALCYDAWSTMIHTEWGSKPSLLQYCRLDIARSHSLHPDHTHYIQITLTTSRTQSCIASRSHLFNSTLLEDIWKCMCAYQGWSVTAQLSSHSKSMSSGQCHKVLCITKTPTWHANFSATDTHLTAAPLASLPPWPKNPAPSSAHLPS